MTSSLDVNDVTREELEEYAAQSGVESPGNKKKYPSKDALLDAVVEAGGGPPEGDQPDEDQQDDGNPGDWVQITAPKRLADLKARFLIGNRVKGMRMSMSKGVFKAYERKD